MDRDRRKQERMERRIQDEIRHRVLERSRNLEGRRRKLEEEKIQLEALEELSDLPREEIEEIARNVRSEYSKPRGKTKKRRKKSKADEEGGYGCIIGLFLGIALIGAGIFIVRGVSEQRAAAREEKAENEYALIQAADEGNLEMVKHLVEEKEVSVNIHKAHPSFEEAAGGRLPKMLSFNNAFETRSPLMAAARGSHQELVEYLLAKGADITYWTEAGYGALSLADGPDSSPVVPLLGAKTAEAFPEGSAVRKLWQKGIPYSGYRFVISAKENDPEAVALFLEAGMDVNLNNFNWPVGSALAEAVAAGNVEIVRTLLDRGEEMDQQDVDRSLLKAADRDNLEIVKSLLDWGADIEYSDSSSETALFRAGDPELIRYLLENGADPNTKVDNSTKLTQVLWRASYNGHRPEYLEIVKLLLDHGADPSVGFWIRRDSTALNLAGQISNQEYEKLLLEAEASR